MDNQPSCPCLPGGGRGGGWTAAVSTVVPSLRGCSNAAAALRLRLEQLMETAKKGDAADSNESAAALRWALLIDPPLAALR